MARFICFCLPALLAAGSLFAQPENRSVHIVRLDLLGLCTKGLSLDYELRPKGQDGIDIQLNYLDHGDLHRQFFNGDWIRTYAQTRVDSLFPQSENPLQSSGWKYLGDIEPLPAVPEKVSVSSVYVKASFSVPYTTANGRWTLLLQPGYFAGRHQYFEVKDVIQVEDKREDIWYLNGGYKAIQQALYYRQIRSMRLKNKALFGMAFDLALSRRLYKSLFIELRGSLGLNINAAYSETLSAPANRFWVRPAVNAGWMF